MTAMTAGATSVDPYAKGHRRRARRQQLRWLVRSVIMWCLALAFLMPFAWMLSSSLKREIDVFRVPMQWIPNPIEWGNYVTVWTGRYSIGRYFVNSGIVVAARVIGEVILAALAGYGFARVQFRGRNVLFLAVLATTVVPGQLLLVPRFIFFRQIGLYDTLWALILPGLASAFGTFLLRQHFASAPRELGEAARIDGANEIQIFFHVYLPMARPMLAAYAILVFNGAWNDYETPLVMISSDAHYTVPLGLTRFIDADSGGLTASLAMAASVSSVIPILIFFLIFQRQFTESMARIGLK